MKDFFGQKIKVGDILVYPVRRRSSMWLTKIRVTDLDDAVHGVNDNRRRITLSRPERSVIITSFCEYCGRNPGYGYV